MKKFDLTFYLLVLCCVPWPVVMFILRPLARSEPVLGVPPPFSEFSIVHMESWIILISLSLSLLSLLSSLLMLLLRKKATTSWGFASIFFLVAAFLWLFPLPPFGSTRESSRRICCASYLKQIYYALQQYAKDNQSNFPPELETLVKSEYLTDPGVYRCPSDWKDNGFTNYLYSGAGHKLTEKPPFVLLEDLPDNHPGTFRNRLYSDGKIENCYPGSAAK